MSSNKTIGMVTCPLCNEPAAVRKDKNGRFYYISRAGRLSPSNDFGQQWFAENATIWGDDGLPPDDAPEWIVDGKSWPDNSMSRHRAKPKKDTTGESDPAPASDSERASDDDAAGQSSSPTPEPEQDDGGFLGYF